MAMKEFSIAILFFIYLRSNKIGHKKPLSLESGFYALIQLILI